MEATGTGHGEGGNRTIAKVAVIELAKVIPFLSKLVWVLYCVHFYKEVRFSLECSTRWTIEI